MSVLVPGHGPVRAVAVLIVIVVLSCISARDRVLIAQQPPAGSGLDVIEVAGNVHMIAGDGGNIAVQTGPDGVVVVDSGAGRRSDEVIAAIKRLSDRPI